MVSLEVTGVGKKSHGIETGIYLHLLLPNILELIVGNLETIVVLTVLNHVLDKPQGLFLILKLRVFCFKRRAAENR